MILVSHCQSLHPKLLNDPTFNIESIIKRIRGFRCHTSEDLLVLLQTLNSELRKPNSTKPKLIVIDSVASPFRVSHFESVKKRCNAIANLSCLLVELLNSTGACIVLSNHITTKLVDNSQGVIVGNYFVPLLGDFWGTTAHVRILLSEDSVGRKMTVFKMMSEKRELENEASVFQITKNGIRDVNLNSK